MLYHVCAKWITDNQPIYFDGLLTTPEPITTMEQYRQVKRDINAGAAGRMTLVSLTPLPK